jgi:hypothetical protein
VLENEVGVREGEKSVSVEFYSNNAIAKAKVLPQCWRPSDQEDTAILQLEGNVSVDDFGGALSELPTGHQTAFRPVSLPLGFSAHLRDASAANPRKLRTFGFPAKPNMGLPGICEVVGTARLKPTVDRPIVEKTVELARELLAR